MARVINKRHAGSRYRQSKTSPDRLHRENLRAGTRLSMRSATTEHRLCNFQRDEARDQDGQVHLPRYRFQD